MGSPPQPPPEDLTESEARLRTIFEHANDGIFLVRLGRDQIVDANPAACRMLGYTRSQLLEMGMKAIVRSGK